MSYQVINTFTLRVLIKMKQYRIIKQNLESILKQKKTIDWKIISGTVMPEEFLALLWEFLDYNIVSAAQTLSVSFITNKINDLNLRLVSKYQVLTMDFITANLSILYFPYILMYQDSITEEFLLSKLPTLSDSEKRIISQYRTLSEDFMEDNISDLNVPLLSKYQNYSYTFFKDVLYLEESLSLNYFMNNKKLPKDFFTENIEDLLIATNIPINLLIEKASVTEEFIKRMKCKLLVKKIIKYQILSEDFIHKYRYWLNWTYVSKYQTLSEPFIETHTEFVNWKYISKYQNLSCAFIDNHIDKLHLDYISKYQNLDGAFLRMHYAKFKPDLLIIYQQGLLINISDADEPPLRIFDLLRKKEIHYKMISKYQNLTALLNDSDRSAAPGMNYIDLYKLDWDFISRYQTLSFTLIKKYKDYLNWTLISRFQTLNTSEVFLNEEVKDYIQYYNIAACQDLSSLETYITIDLANGTTSKFLKTVELLYYYQTGFSEEFKTALEALIFA
jgi:hypothetical protein